jgi:hypothetical protein
VWSAKGSPGGASRAARSLRSSSGGRKGSGSSSARSCSEGGEDSQPFASAARCPSKRLAVLNQACEELKEAGVVVLINVIGVP